MKINIVRGDLTDITAILKNTACKHTLVLWPVFLLATSPSKVFVFIQKKIYIHRIKLCNKHLFWFCCQSNYSDVKYLNPTNRSCNQRFCTPNTFIITNHRHKEQFLCSQSVCYIKVYLYVKQACRISLTCIHTSVQISADKLVMSPKN